MSSLGCATMITSRISALHYGKVGFIPTLYRFLLSRLPKSINSGDSGTATTREGNTADCELRQMFSLSLLIAGLGVLTP
jgi:hypothetical protein